MANKAAFRTMRMSQLFRRSPAMRIYVTSDRERALKFQVADLDAEYGWLGKTGVEFRSAATDAGSMRAAVFDGTCGNLIQLIELKGA